MEWVSNHPYASAGLVAVSAAVLLAASLRNGRPAPKTKPYVRPAIAGTELGPHKGWVSAVVALHAPAVDPAVARLSLRPADEIGRESIAVTGGYDMSVRFWRHTLAQGTEVEVFTGAGCRNIVRSIARLEMGGREVIATGQSAFGGATIQIFDVGRIDVAKELTGHSMAILDLQPVRRNGHASLRNGQYLFSCCPDQSLRMFPVTDDDDSDVKGQIFTEYTDRLLSVASLDSDKLRSERNLVAAGSFDNSVLLFPDFTQGTKDWVKLPEGHCGHVTKVRFDPYSTALISTGYDAKVIQWDLTSQRKASEMSLPEAVQPISAMALGGVESPGLVATGAQDNFIRLWDFRSSKGCVADIRGHKDIVLALDFGAPPNTPHLLFSGSKDRSLLVHDLRKITAPIGGT